MKVLADESDTAATWYYADEIIQLAAVWTEKKQGRGEDAPPTALHHRAGRGVLAVYDGAGGTGARSVGLGPDSREISGAFLASRITHFAFEDWFVATRPQRPLADSADLHDAILAGLLRPGIAPGTKISGTLVRHLPTTIAALEYEIAGPDLNIVARWAGDSRAYVLDPAEGMQAVTKDDSEDGDALNSIANDQPMTNMICADRPFRINEFKLDTIRLPTVLLCATDGFYNYLETPAHFEYLLLSAMSGAESLQGWTARLANLIQGYAADDTSLVIAAFGFQEYAFMQRAFRQRARFLYDNYVRPLHEMGGSEDRERVIALRRSQWEEYRVGYERRIR
jgi:hypothetical protein